jgi:hypothetical protein
MPRKSATKAAAPPAQPEPMEAPPAEKAIRTKKGKKSATSKPNEAGQSTAPRKARKGKKSPPVAEHEETDRGATAEEKLPVEEEVTAQAAQIITIAEDTPAGVALRLDAASRDAVIGYVLIDLFSSEYHLKFGTWNSRPVKKAQVTKLLKSMDANGIRLLDHNNFIYIILKKEDLDMTPRSNAYHKSGLEALKVKRSSALPLVIKAASGQHRLSAIKTKREGLKARIDALEARKMIDDNDNDEEDDPDFVPDEDEDPEGKSSDSENEDTGDDTADESRTSKIEALKGEMEKLRWWGATIYDEGEVLYCNVPFADDEYRQSQQERLGAGKASFAEPDSA